MAKNVGVIGAMKGKVGNMVFRTRRGMQIASVYQPEVHNPKSKRQEMSRAKMTMATYMARGCKLLLKAGWQKTNPTYEVQQFVSRAIPVGNHVITGNSVEMLEWDWMNVGKCVSANLLGFPTGLGTPSFAEESEVILNYTPDSNLFVDDQGAEIGCGLVVGCYSPDLNQCIVTFLNLTKGQAAQATVAVPAEWSGLKCVVMAFAKQIPNALNGIPANTQPWKFPAATTMCRSWQGTIA